MFTRRSDVVPRSKRSSPPCRGGILLRNERGSQLVEFAIAGLLFLTLLFGIMEFGRAVWIYGTAAHAAKEGARWAIVRGAESGRAATATDVESYVRSRATGMTSVTVTTTWSPDNKPGSVVQVKVDCPFQPVLPLLPSMTLTSTSRMVISF
jgi:Flp pilus assembly protein TadG